MTVLIGTVGLSQALGWYFDPLRQIDADAARVIAAGPPARPAPGRQVRSLPAATREELALVGSDDVELQLKGAETLLTRAITPDLVNAVEKALSTARDERVQRLLVCVKSRFQDAATLELLLARFPREPGALDWQTTDVACMLDALVERIAEAPSRITATLMPAIYAANGAMRHKVLAAFRTVDLPFLPISLATEARGAGGPRRREALAAVMALGAISREPAIVAAAVRDPQMSAIVRGDLRADPHPNAARIVARVWAEHPFHFEHAELARAREAVHHDVSAGLLEIVAAPDEPERTRIAAAKHLGVLAEVGALNELRSLAAELPAGELRLTVEDSIRTLQQRRTAGMRASMRALPQ